MAEQAVPETQRTPMATRAKRYAHSGLGKMSAEKHMNHCSFGTHSRETKMSPESERAKRDAQCVFVGMSALSASCRNSVSTVLQLRQSEAEQR